MVEMTALERIKEQDPDKLDEFGFCAKEEGHCGQCGFDAKFLLKAFLVMREIAIKNGDLGCLGHDTEEGAEMCDCPKGKEIYEIDQEFEERMKNG